MPFLKLNPNKRRNSHKGEAASFKRDQAPAHRFDGDKRLPASAGKNDNNRWSAGNLGASKTTLRLWRPAGFFIVFIVIGITAGQALQGVRVFPAGHKPLPPAPKTMATTTGANNDACLVNKTYKIHFYGPNGSQLQREFNTIVNELELNCLPINWNGLGHFRESDRTIAIYYSEGARDKAQDEVSIIRKAFRDSKSTTKVVLRHDRFTFDSNFKGNSRVVSIVYAPYRWLNKK